jgi:hypothetical protein
LNGSATDVSFFMYFEIMSYVEIPVSNIFNNKWIIILWNNVIDYVF